MSTFCHDSTEISESTSYQFMRYRKNKFQWMKECQSAFEHIRKLLITKLVLHILTVNSKFMLENDTSKMAAEGAFF